MNKTSLSLALISTLAFTSMSAFAEGSSFVDYINENGEPEIPAELLPYMENSNTAKTTTETVVNTAQAATVATVSETVETEVKETAEAVVEKAVPTPQVSGKLTSIPVPTLSVSNAAFIPSISIPKNNSGETIDVTLLDAFLKDVAPNARHYPTNFPDKTQAYNTTQHIKKYAAWIDTYAKAPDASYDVLIRAAQLNGMGRNMDMGTTYAINGSKYVARALKLNSSDVEANVLYGLMLAEGGGFKEGRKYLDKAAAMGSVEAEQSIAQSDLMTDKRASALSRLQKLQSQNPGNTQLADQIAIVEAGKYYIWDLPAPNINVKPVS